MKKADENVWNDWWDRTQGSVSISDIDYVIFSEFSKLVEFHHKEILELGCGRGVLSYLFLKGGAKKCSLVDFSAAALNLARTLFKGNNHVEYVQSDLFKVDESKQYDIVFSSGVAEHFSGQLREEIIYKHLRLTKDLAVLILPARPHLNTFRHKKKKIVDLYGWQYSFSKQEMKDFISNYDGFDIIANHRFCPAYGVDMFGIFAMDDKLFCSRYWNYGLHFMDKVFTKIGLYKLINIILSPFSDYIGGLLIAVIKKR